MIKIWSDEIDFQGKKSFVLYVQKSGEEPFHCAFEYDEKSPQSLIKGIKTSLDQIMREIYGLDYYK